MRNTLKLLGRLLGGVAVVVLLTGSLAGGKEVPEWKRAHAPGSDAWQTVKQHLVFNSGAEPETLDPALVTSMDSFQLVDCLFEGLTTVDPKTLVPRPGVASTWEVSADGRVYTFHLRKDAKWSDGKALTATDFIAAWKRALTPSTAASYASLFFYIQGAEAFYHGKTDDFAEVGVRAADPHTISITLNSPCGFLLDLLSMPVFHPVRVDVIKAHGERWTQPEHIVGNGAFALQQWRPRDALILARSETYWDRDFVKIEQITALIVDDLNTAYKRYQAGGIHWLPTVPLPRMDELKRHPDFYSTPFFGTYFFRFNVRQAPFDDRRVRRAFSMATNRREITDDLLKGGQQPKASLCPEVAGYQPVPGVPYDVAAARQLLAAAGYPDGKGFPTVELIYNTSEGNKQVCEAVAQQWQRNLGVKAATRNLEWKVFLADMKDLKFQVCRSSWIGDYGDPSTFFDIFESTSGNNRTGWASPAYDALLSRTRTEIDPAKRLALFAEMETLLVTTECPILPLYGYVNVGLLSEAVSGWYPNVRNQHPLKYIWLE